MAKAVKKKKLAKKTTPKQKAKTKAKAVKGAKAKPKRSYVKRTQAEVKRPKRKYTRKEKPTAEVPDNLVALVKVGLDWMTDILREIAGINRSLEKLASAKVVYADRDSRQVIIEPRASVGPTLVEVDALLDDEIFTLPGVASVADNASDYVDQTRPDQACTVQTHVAIDYAADQGIF